MVESSNWVRGSCIGRGSFGTVSLAVDKSDGRVFAVKSVPLQRNTTLRSAQMEALESEIRILRFISSPFVVGYLGDDLNFQDNPGAFYRNLHLEYLPGGTVDELAKRSGAIDEETLSSYTRCIVSALKHIHERGIVHCDVKGKNVLVVPDSRSAKLADFGSAVELGSLPAAVRISPRGSPLWMAPEVIRGEYQGPESDVWSLGCTIIEMVTGNPGWEDRGSDTLCQIGYSNQLPKFPTQLSELGRDFLQKCLRREPNERWSCDQLLRHPFLSCPAPSQRKWSPRCVFDWSDSNFPDREEDDQYENSHSGDDAKQRIGKLASQTGAIWESSGWVVVRNLVDGDQVSEDKEEGTSSAYLESTRTEDVICPQGISEYSDSVENARGSGRANWEYSNNNVAFGHTCPPGAEIGGLKFVSLLLNFLLNHCIFIHNFIYQQRLISSYISRRFKLISVHLVSLYSLYKNLVNFITPN